jgi:hypothetical protein
MGREIRYVDIPGDAFKAGLLEAGLEEWLAHDLMTLNELVAEGAEARVTEDVDRVTGCPARTFAEFVADCTDTFRT